MTSVLESLNQALHFSLESDQSVYILGEDILDPYGGAFKITKGVSTAYPDRTLTTPVSEAGIVGVATGMALRGLRPVVEIMFGDFITLAADQMINHLAKFRYMYNDLVRVPLVIRAPMGGRRGYGPTHSQSLEKLFLGIPGIKIIAACNFGDPGKLLYDAIIKDLDPVLFIENKILYSLPVHGFGENGELSIKEIKPSQPPTPNHAIEYPPANRINLIDAPLPSITIATYGYMGEICTQAALKLAYESEIFTEVIVFNQLTPFVIEPLLESLRITKKLLAVEEGTYTMGWGAEILSRSIEEFRQDRMIAARVASADTPIPASGSLEKSTFPDVDDVIQAIQLMV